MSHTRNGSSTASDLGQIFSRLKAGDREAAAEIVEAWGDRLYRTALGIVRSRAAAEDVVQETMLKAITRGGGFEGRSDPGTWLYRVCVNTAYDHLRRRNRRETARPLHGSPGAAAPAAELGEIEERLDLRAAVDALPPQLRVTLILHYVEDLRVGDVARVTGVAAGTVKARLHRAREMLRAKTSEGDVT